MLPTAVRPSRIAPAALLAALGLTHPQPLTAQKTDTLYLNNGDRIVGEIKALTNGRLEYKTDNVGTIQVKWDRVVRLTSRHYFEVETMGGRRHFGTLPHVDSATYLAVALDRIELLRMAEVVAISRIKQTSVWGRIDGYLDLGFSYAKSNATLQITSGLEATYLTKDWTALLKGDLFMQRQRDANTTRRWSVQPVIQRQYSSRWIAYGLGQVQQNEGLGLDLRTLGSVGGGRNLILTNSHEARAFVGLATSREWYIDSTSATDVTVNNLEVAVSGSYRAFRYDSPELDFALGAELYPSLTDLGRVRVESDARVRYEILGDFFVTAAFKISVDSRPPAVARTQNVDHTTTLSITWKF